MKVLAISDWFPPDNVGGAERTISELADYLESIGHEVMFLSIERKLNQNLVNFREVNSFFSLHIRRSPKSPLPIRVIDTVIGFIDPISPFFLAKKARKLDPEIIVVHQQSRLGIFFPFWLRKLMPDSRVIIRVYHDLSETCIFRTRFRQGQVCQGTCMPCKPKAAISRYSARFFDFHIFNSYFLRDKYEILGYQFDRAMVGYPIIISEDLDIEVNSNQVIESRTLKDENYLNVGFVGRLCDEKGVKTLLIALAKQDEKYRLHTVGDGNLKFISELISLAVQLNIELISHGFREDPFVYIADFVDIVVISSELEEAFGRVVMEAAIDGIPTIVSDIGGLHEAVNLIEPAPKLFQMANPNFSRRYLTQAAANRPRRIIVKHSQSMAYAIKVLMQSSYRNHGK